MKKKTYQLHSPAIFRSVHVHSFVKIILACGIICAFLFFIACSDTVAPSSPQTISHTSECTCQFPPSDAKDLLNFRVIALGKMLDATISQDTISISQSLPFGSSASGTGGPDVTVTDIVVSHRASPNLQKGSTILFQNHESTLTIVAEDTSTKDYTIVRTPIESILLKGTYVGETNILTQAIKDNGNGTPQNAVLKNTDVVITVSHLADGELFSWNIDGAVSTGFSEFSPENGEFSLTREMLTPIISTFSASPNSDTNTTQELTLNITHNSTNVTKTVSLRYHPSEIWSWHDVQAMRMELAGKYVQKKDIDFSDASPAYNFEPIALDTDSVTDLHQGNTFVGTYDGGSFFIKNLSIDKPNNDYVGLFGSVGGTQNAFLNIQLTNASIKGRKSVGAIVGHLAGGSTLIGSVLSGTIEGTDDNVGGLAGISAGDISGYNAANVDGNRYVGGLVGISEATELTRGHNSGSISGTHYVGGLVGSSLGTVRGYNTGTVTADNTYVGGLTGKGSSIVGYNVGDVTGNNRVGGLSGEIDSTTATGYNMGIISGKQRVGGLVGEMISTATVIGYNRGHIVRTTGNKNSFGRISGAIENNVSITGFYSNKTEEDVFPANVQSTSENYETAISISAMTASTDFAPFVFGNADGEWSFIQEKWPSITLPQEVGGNYDSNKQPLDP